jgi:twitching motility two-component system response regulator PilH
VKKILVVDDSMSMVRMIQSVLEKGGYVAIGISDPSRIEQTIDSERPNVILLDVVMPEKLGSLYEYPGHPRELEIDIERPLLG